MDTGKISVIMSFDQVHLRTCDNEGRPKGNVKQCNKPIVPILSIQILIVDCSDHSVKE